ncbi:MAG: F0F1 ATP synthase subunit delta [Verrucomicrobiae bacterium]|nr:F0F1 ATP synthase subunit delta [Verrucomicrobiae bacterium]
MQKDETLRKFARNLATLSLEDGLVSAERVQAVLGALGQKPPRKPKTVLKYYLHYVKQAINQSRAVIEYAGEIDSAEIRAIEEQLTRTYNRPISSTTVENEDLIAGFRISIGDDIYDASVLGRLATLEKSIR